MIEDNENGPQDPLEIDSAHVFSQRYMAATGLSISTPFLVDVHRVGGDVLTIYFPSIATLAHFLREMMPRRIFYHLHANEDHDELEFQVSSAGKVQPAALVLH